MTDFDEVCRLAEDAYDRGLVKPAPHNLFDRENCTACALGAAAVNRLVARGRDVADLRPWEVSDELCEIIEAVRGWGTSFGFGFDGGVQGHCGLPSWGPTYVVGHAFGVKIREKFKLGEKSV